MDENTLEERLAAYMKVARDVEDVIEEEMCRGLSANDVEMDGELTQKDASVKEGETCVGNRTAWKRTDGPPYLPSSNGAEMKDSTVDSDILYYQTKAGAALHARTLQRREWQEEHQNGDIPPAPSVETTDTVKI